MPVTNAAYSELVARNSELGSLVAELEHALVLCRLEAEEGMRISRTDGANTYPYFRYLHLRASNALNKAAKRVRAKHQDDEPGPYYNPSLREGCTVHIPGVGDL